MVVRIPVGLIPFLLVTPSSASYATLITRLGVQGCHQTCGGGCHYCGAVVVGVVECDKPSCESPRGRTG